MADTPIDLTLYAIPAFIFLMAVEGLYLWRHRESGLQGYAARDTAASLSMGLGYSAINLGWKGIAFAFYTALYQLTPLRRRNHPPRELRVCGAR